jgi:sortase A
VPEEEQKALLRIGTAMMLFAVALAAVVAVVVALSSLLAEEESASQQAASVEPLPSEATQREKRAFDPGEKLEIDDEPPEETRPERREAQTLPVAPDDWPTPSSQEVAATQAPRYYPQRQDGVMTLTVEGIGLYGVPVINANTQEALDAGVIHFPQTPMPWDERDQKNVYLAGHRLGFPNTGSRLVFYNLDKLKEGDSVVLQDSLGEPYEYRVSEVFVVEPDADWVVDPVRGRDTVTLQTCTFPDLLNRLIVRAARV